MVTRLAPSQAGGTATWGALNVGTAVPIDTGVPAGFVVVTGTVTCPGQVDGEIPARAVNRQQATKLREKMNNPTATTSPVAIQINWLVDGRFRFRDLFRKSNFLSTIYLDGRWQRQAFYS
jgi:hypothetical protein